MSQDMDFKREIKGERERERERERGKPYTYGFFYSLLVTCKNETPAFPHSAIFNLMNGFYIL